jgi:hypothetical protein
LSTDATTGGMGLLGLLPGSALAARGDNRPETILDIAATAEVLATIVNTVGPERVALDAQTKANIEAAAREELLHYQALTGAFGNDRAYMRFAFDNITTAPRLLQRAGFGFGAQGSEPGAFYEFDEVRRRTPNPQGVNTREAR